VIPVMGLRTTAEWIVERQRKTTRSCA